jgi:hypothetical protein
MLHAQLCHALDGEPCRRTVSGTWVRGTCWRCAATHRPVLWIGAAKIYPAVPTMVSS